ncbi:MAG: CHAT domain-containing protein [Gammaproteobacteria bacterium]|nr:CHAT domain-containing protein [Gammaproteobacteria bacterium]
MFATDLFILDLVTRPAEVELRLSDARGVHLAARQTDLNQHPPALWEGLFDTRNHVQRYGFSRAGAERKLLEELGRFLGEQVLGAEIMDKLTADFRHRTLLIRLPDTEKDLWAAAFARVPWEIARAKNETLAELNLAVRAVTAATELSGVLEQTVKPEESLRVLLAFTETPASNPLAARLERERLLELFHQDILPRRQVEVDVLCHGVTRAAIETRVRERGGYHIVHWSGHGHHNTLELAGEDGGAISGQGLVRLFQKAGGFIPQLMFLSACHSGSFMSVRDWAGLRAAIAGQGELSKKFKQAERSERSENLREIVTEQPGYTGAALELLKARVPQVVAMRYAVGDTYARRLARRFYKHLLADKALFHADSALLLARNELLQDARADEFAPIDHATPLLFGRSRVQLHPRGGRSPQLNKRRPQPYPLLPGSAELDPPFGFVGRGAELARLAAEWLPRSRDKSPLVIIQGLAGLGKTALAAEIINCWHSRFDWVFAFQSKGVPLNAEDFYRRLDQKLVLASQVYCETCAKHPNRKIFLDPVFLDPVSSFSQEAGGSDLENGEARYGLMRENLLQTLRDEAILLAVDNFESNLMPLPDSGAYRCRDPEWVRILTALSGLTGSDSRIVFTSRHLPAALPLSGQVLLDPPQPGNPENGGVMWLPLGPLPMAQALLYLENREQLRQLRHGDKAERELALRVLEISRGHPLILQRLGDLAKDRAALRAALDRFAAQGLFKTLPDVFVSSRDGRETERRYLEEVANGAVRLLIERATADARRLLRVITLAAEPVPEALLAEVWSEQSPDQKTAQKEQRPELPEIPPELQAEAAAENAPLAPLLEELTVSGLLQREGEGYSFHELVREGCQAWMEAHPQERGKREEQAVYIAYGQAYEAVFQSLQQANQREQASEAGRRGLSYLIRGKAYDQLGNFAGELILGTQDPRLLRGVIAELKMLPELLPAGETRWSVRTYLADALRMAGQPRDTLPFYEKAVVEAEAAGHWSHVGTICQNWANALGDAGQLSRARETFLRSAEAGRRAGSPELDVTGSALEALRVDVEQGQAAAALPAIEKHLGRVRGWQREQQAGQTPAAAPDAELLARTLVGALNIAWWANHALENWQACLDLLTEQEEVEQVRGEPAHGLAITRFNRYPSLLQLERLDEAQQVLEGCLQVFQEADDLLHQSKTLSALADLWDERGDSKQAIKLQTEALAVRERLPYLEDRAISHGNLSEYLYRAGRVEASKPHFVAGLVYFMLMGHHEINGQLNNHAIRVQEAAENKREYTLPSLAEVAALPEFEALKKHLTEQGLEAAGVQERLDAVLAGQPA